MDHRLQKLVDESDIRRLLADYAHGCDRCDEALMSSVYAKDSWDDHGFVQAPGEEFARRMTQEIIPASCDTLSHLLGQSIIQIEGDIARVETYYLAVTLSEVDGQARCNQLGGRYADRLERDAGGWKIKRRTCIRDWSVSIEVKNDAFSHANLTPGLRGALDPGDMLLRNDAQAA